AYGLVLALTYQTEAAAAAAITAGLADNDCFGARHLGHVSGVDEADRLDAFRPGGLQPLDEVGAHGALQHGLLVLQAVARADLDELDETSHQRALRSPAPAGAQPGRAPC